MSKPLLAIYRKVGRYQARRALNSMQTLEDVIIRFDINPSHSLKHQNTEHYEKSQAHYTTCWYIEKDDKERIVARYRSWSNQAKQPPYRAQIGWERYSPSGTLMEREVHYSKPDNGTALH